MPKATLTGCTTALALMGALMFAGPVMAQDHAHAAPAADHGHHHADFQSGRFHVRIDGEGPRDIILIPGLGSSPEVWDATVAALGSGYRVHRLHIQGFAGAGVKDNGTGPVAAPVAEDLARYIREQGLDRPAVIGHSMGGSIGLMLAARHPELVGRLMVVDMVPFVGAMFGPGMNAETIVPVADAVHARQTTGPLEAYQQQAAAVVVTMIQTENQRAGPLQDTATSDRAVSANAYRELLVTDLRPEMAAITVPTEVVYVAFAVPGMTPAMTDAIYQDQFSGLDGVVLTRIDDSAHFVMLDQPARFADEVKAFLEPAPAQ